MDRVAARAQPVVLQLKVEAAVEIERRAILLELGAYPRTVGKDEIDLLRSRQESALNCRDGHALGAFLFDPLEGGEKGPGLNRDAQNDLVLDNEARDGLPDLARLRTEQAEQKRQ